MSAENVQVARKLYELFARRDVAAAFPDLAHPDFEFRVPPVYPDAPEVFRGLEGVQDWMTMIDEAWAEWRFEPERYLEAGSTVVVLARLVAEGGSSGIHLSARSATSGRSTKGERPASGSTWIEPKRSKPPGFRSNALDERRERPSACPRRRSTQLR